MSLDAIDFESTFIKNYYMNAAKFLIIMLVVSSSITAQNLVFDEMDHLPEFELFRPYFETENNIWLSNSLELECALAISDTTNDFRLEYFEGVAPRQFAFHNLDTIIGFDLTNYYFISNNSIDKVNFEIGSGESFIGVLPSIDSRLFVPTNRGIYISDDNGNTSFLIREWSENNVELIQHFLIDGKLHLLSERDNIQYYEIYNKEWNLNYQKQLEITASNFISFGEKVFFTDRASNLFTLDINSSNITAREIQQQGAVAVLRKFNDQLVINNFSEGVILLFEDNFIDYESFILPNRLFPSLSSSLFYFTFGPDILIPTSLNPLRFDTISPNVTATKINDLKTYNDNIYVQTDNAFYALEEDEWIQRQQGGLRFEVDHAGNVLVDGPDTGLDEIWYSTDNALSFSKLPIDYIIGTRMINFEDTTLVTGRQNCDEFDNSFDSGMTTDGSVSWQSNVVEEPRCFEQRFTTITPDRVYIYDHDEDYALGPGNAIYSWFSYYNRNDKTFFNVGGDPAIMPFIPTSSNQLSSNNVSFYVSPDEIFYANPLKDNVSGYHSLDRGSTWIETPDSPTGRIYPTADSIGTIVIQNDPDGKLGTKFFLRYDLDEPYVELNVSPELPPIEYLKYTSDGRMIVGSETGYFYITDGITSAIDNISTQQNRVIVYPNPSSDVLRIRSQDVIQEVRIRDIDGQLVHQTSYVEEAISIRTWLSGMYIVEVMMRDGQRVVEKVVKM